MAEANQAMIFDIQRCSFADGPGIRTTVFFKGCNLRCKWCHNPEGISADKQMMFFKDKCTGCGLCAAVCEGGDCVLCGRCADVCPVGARKVCGAWYDVQALLGIVSADKPFYDNSGGGVTLSGGECMLQIGFLKAFLSGCADRGIHTAVDTAGHVPFEYFERIEPFTDLFLYDIKALDSGLHKALTGVGNELILANFEKLVRLCPGKLLVRVPVIPGANGGEIDGISAYVRERGVPVELLPYHSFGKSKAAALPG